MNLSAIKYSLAVFALVFSTVSWGIDQRLKVEGVWDGHILQVNRIKLRDPDKDVRRIRVSGAVAKISQAEQWIQIGPVRLDWQESQQETFSSIRVGDSLRVDAIQYGFSTYTILRSEPASLDSEDSIELIGTLNGYQDNGEWAELSLAGIPARTPRRLFRNGRPRLQRLGDRRPDNQLVLQLGKTAVTIGGELEVKGDGDFERDLDHDSEDRQVDLDQEVQLEAFFDINDLLSVFVELKAEQSQRYHFPWQRVGNESEIRRGLSWLYLSQPLGIAGGIQIGRQNFAEMREWWWDDDLDALRLESSIGSFRYAIAVGEELTTETLGADHGDAEDEDIFRLLATGRLRLSSEFIVELFYLYQNDHSNTFDVGRILPEHREDEVDAKLSWTGARLSGDMERIRNIDVTYWLDLARVAGTEVQQEFIDINSREIEAAELIEQDRDGWAIDAGASFVWPDTRWAFLKEPAVTLGYAYGSGADSSKGTFVQTGLNDNSGKFNGVNRFRYYGELTRPELSNLRITTLALGFRIGQDSSIEFIHHNYQQAHISGDHSLRIDPDANARSTDLGDEFNITLGIEEWQHWQLELNASHFIPGNAFDERDSASSLSLKIGFNF